MPLQEGHYAARNPAWLRNGSPSAYKAESIDRHIVTSDVAAALVTQVMTHVAIPVQAGDVITNITFVAGATAAGTPTNWWFALYSAATTPALLGQTADQLTAAWATDAAKTLALTTAFQATADGVLYAVCMVKATTVPSLLCKVLPRATFADKDIGFTGQKRLAGTSDTGLTTTAPATMGAITAVVNIPYCVLS
jgi:hypothetical protein